MMKQASFSLVVKDIQRSIDFYVDKLGFEVVYFFPFDKSQAMIAELEKGGVRIKLQDLKPLLFASPFKQDLQQNKFGVGAELIFLVEDVNEYHQMLIQKGWQIYSYTKVEQEGRPARAAEFSIQDPDGYTLSFKPYQRAGQKISQKTTEPMTVAYISHRGSYGEIGPLFLKLFEWANTRGIAVSGPPLGIFYDDPSKTPVEKQRSEACIPIDGKPLPEGRIRIRKLDPMNVACITHLGPMREYPATYSKLVQWIESNHYAAAGPTFEVYYGTPTIEKNELLVHSEIQIPIRRMTESEGNPTHHKASY
jgi:effector-binding domain-containing protein